MWTIVAYSYPHTNIKDKRILKICAFLERNLIKWKYENWSHHYNNFTTSSNEVSFIEC
jgi:hypothetical protein